MVNVNLSKESNPPIEAFVQSKLMMEGPRDSAGVPLSRRVGLFRSRTCRNLGCLAGW